MLLTYDALLSVIHRACIDIAYRDELVVQDYQYADLLAAPGQRRNAALAAFAQEPTSYRTACLAVVDEAPHPSLIAAHRALGAPVVISAHRHDSDAHIWRMTAAGDPRLIESIARDDLPNLIRRQLHTWGPTHILRAKMIGGPTPARQLDFFDLGLLPALETEVHQKLDALLRGVLHVGMVALTAGSRRAPSERRIQELYRLVFRLLLGKVLADRRHPGYHRYDSPGAVLAEVTRVFLPNAAAFSVLDDEPVQHAVWAELRTALDLSHISGEALADVYENTLVSRQTRKLLDIHATPPEVADYIVRRLPLGELPVEERRVFEPFAGHAPFLTAAMGQLKALLPSKVQGAERHAYLVRMLWGMELDAFAGEVAQQSLVLADYPYGNGWNILEGDVFESDAFDVQLAAASVVLCNPPYSAFAPAGEVEQRPKALEAVRRILTKPPQLLGLVLPLAFIHSNSYRDVRRELDGSYADIEVLELPDSTFRHADEQIAVITAATDTRSVQPKRVAIRVNQDDRTAFFRHGVPAWRESFPRVAVPTGLPRDLWRTPTERAWEETSTLPRLVDFVSQRCRGLEYNLSWRTHEKELTSRTGKRGFAPGIGNVSKTFEPYVARPEYWLRVSKEAIRWAEKSLRPGPKVLVNFGRLSRGPWVIAAIVDRQELAFYQNFIGFWPAPGFEPELLAAVLNGPVANAYIAERELKRHIRIQTLERVPVPLFSRADAAAIIGLVREYEALRRRWLEETAASGTVDLLSEGEAEGNARARECARLQRDIDAAVLKAYDLSPRVERALLDQFSGATRPGPAPFTHYFPPEYTPALPYHTFIAAAHEGARAQTALHDGPVLKRDASTNAAMEDLWDFIRGDLVE